MMQLDLIGDWALAVLTVAATIALYVRIQFLDPRLFCRRWAYRVTALGWTVLSARLWVTLCMGGDPAIHPASLIGLSIVCLGTCWVSFDIVLKAHNRLCQWGRE